MRPKKFVRQESSRHSRIGKNRKKLQVWRKPKGRDSKMRLKRKSYPAVPLVGYKTPKKDFGKISGLIPVLVHNSNELNRIPQNSIVIIARIGAKKRMELLKIATEKKIKILNVGEKHETGK